MRHAGSAGAAAAGVDVWVDARVDGASGGGMLDLRRCRSLIRPTRSGLQSLHSKITPTNTIEMAKSTVEEIRARFDDDVERFSNLETGQQAAVDSPLCLELIAQAACGCVAEANDVLDIGCGAGNYTLRFLQQLRSTRGQEVHVPACHLVDLSDPMLQRARQRLASEGFSEISLYQADVRELEIPDESVDVILAAAVLHHLRTPAQWRGVFASMYRWLRPGGSVWIYDMIESENASVAATDKQRYSDYLVELGGDAYRDKVFSYIEKEDTPASLSYQLSLLDEVGFDCVEVLHKNMCFAAFGALKR